MKRALKFLLIAAVAGVFIKGCIFSPKTTDVVQPPPEYKPATSPENVAFNLQTCYERRDIDAYGKLLAPEFRFYFQDADVPRDLGRDYWVHDEDSTHTDILFRTPQVNGISIQLTYGAATVPTELDKPPGSMKIHVTAHVEVDDVNGTTYVVEGDFEDMFFRKGSLENAGEDTTNWYLFEWHDIKNPGGNGAGVPRGGLTPAGAAENVSGATRTVSWGELLKQTGLTSLQN
jgi:hypothetical protein